MSGIVMIRGFNDITSKLSHFLVNSLFKDMRIVLLGVDEDEFKQRLSSILLNAKDMQITVINTYCENLQKFIEEIEVSLRKYDRIINFCLNCYKNDDPRILCVPPYIVIAEIISIRLREILRREVVEVKVKLKNEEVAYLAKLHNVELKDLESLFKKFLRNRENNFSIEIDRKTQIVIQALDKHQASEVRRRITIKLTGTEDGIDNYCSQIKSLLSTMVLNIDIHGKNVTTIQEIGLDEGLYTHYLSILVGCGWNIDIEIEKIL